MNRQIGVGESKYAITGDSLLTCHVTQPNFGPKTSQKHTSSDLTSFFGFFRQATAKTPDPIFTINTSNDIISRKDVPFVPFGDPENKILHFDPIFLQNVKKLPIFDGRDFRLKEALTMGMLT